MRSEAKGGDLLYVGSPATDDVYVYKYPGGELVGTLTGFDNPMGLCSDAQGNVWITNAVSNGHTYLLEYAHGGTKVKAELDDYGFLPLACAIDPATGNLAVGNSIDDVAVWQNARGKPTHYLTSCCVFAPQTITFDGAGDAIFADFQTRSGWLPNGHSKVRKVALHPRPRLHGAFDWDGKYLAVFASRKPRQAEVIRYTFSAGKANEVGTVALDGVTGVTSNSQIWIQDSAVVLTASGSGNVYVFNYPKGGDPTHTISGVDDPFGVTISVAPSGSGIRK